MIIKPIRTRIFKQDENLFDFITHYIKRLPENSVVVVTSKIVALAEGRVVEVANARDKIKLIKSESDFAIKTKYVWLTVKDGIVMASAGIDESNANGKIILLPKDSFKVAAELRKQLMKKFKVKKLGVLITDSRTIPLRAGVTGVALGYAGFYGIRDYRNTPDIFGRKFKFSQTNVVDSLSTTAAFVMGEGNEQRPLAIIQDAEVKFTDRINKKEVHIDFRDDMYKPMFSNFRIKKGSKK